jgi:ABC-type phosphate/phosphonate transport system substrate-binding protein
MSAPTTTAAPRTGNTRAEQSVAALPMYMLAELSAWHDAWWTGLAGHLRAAGLTDVPDRLTRPPDPRHVWGSRLLLFAQTCGYPYTHDFAGSLRLVATPRYSAPGCEGAHYTSTILVRADSELHVLGDLPDHTVAANGPDSFSGYWALLEVMAEICPGRPPFRRCVVTGDHTASLAAVRDGSADVCAVDSVTWALMAAHRPRAIAAFRPIARTRATPGLPYVTAAHRDDATVARLRDGLVNALADPDLAAARAALLLDGAETLDDDAYAEIPRRVREARESCGALASV